MGIILGGESEYGSINNMSIGGLQLLRTTVLTNSKYKHIFTPIKIGSVEIPNRIVMPSMGTNFAEADGSVGQRLINYYAARARGGVGLITVETTATTSIGGRMIGACVTLYDGRFVPALRELTDRVHSHGAKISIQLNHAGRQAILEANGGTIPVAPSSIPCPFCSQIDVGVVPRELTEEEIKEIIQNFGLAALRAKIAGFDAVEVHGAHGYLISQFLSPLTNHRKDAYGGSFEKRMVFVLEVVQEIKRKAGNDFPIIFRLNAEDAIEGGLTIDDTKEIAIKMEQAGVNAISVSSGMYPTLHKCLAPLYYPPAFLIPLATEIKNAVKVPIIGVGRIPNLALAESLVFNGRVDLVAMGRALIAEPDLVNKSKNGQEEDIRPCIYCNFCCMDRLLSFMQVRCAVNAEAGREFEYSLKKTSVPKKVLVIGGGPGGMEAARVAALRGHKVTLVDKEGRLGGQLLVSSIPSFKESHRRLIDYLSLQVKKTGVKVKLGTEVSADDILRLNHDVVILATGASHYIPPNISGADNGVTAIDVLKGKKKVGETVIMCGGGLIGCETALHLVQQGKKVTIVEMLDDVAGDMDFYSKNVLVEKLKEAKVRVITSGKISEVTPQGVIFEDKEGKKQTLKADTVVLALGLSPNRGLVDRLDGKLKEMYVIGDCVKPGRVHNAIQEAAHIAREI